MGPRPADGGCQCSWPVRTESYTPAEQPETTGWSPQSPSSLRCAPMCSGSTALSRGQDGEQRVHTRRPRFQAKSHPVRTVSPSPNEALRCSYGTLLVWGRPAAETGLPFQGIALGALCLKAGPHSLPVSSPPLFPLKAGKVSVACEPRPLALELVLRLMNQGRAGCTGARGRPSCEWLAVPLSQAVTVPTGS